MITLSECSKVNDASPLASVTTTNNELQVIDGRLVFANQQSFEITLNKLAVLNSKDVDLWRKGIAFYSLRDAYNAEIPNIEQLVTSNRAPAYSLTEEFGFPYLYTVILNPVGEYQIGSKIYWYYHKFIYEVNSEQELISIKQNPVSCKVKYATGSSDVRRGSTNGASTSNEKPDARTSQPGGGLNGGYINERYFFEYNKDGDSGSRRRWFFATHIFSTKQARTNNNTTKNWRSYISVELRHQYYSFGNKDWHPKLDRSFIIPE